jgi:predicted RNase H-like nuclease (RuvC/YqgF family)
MTEKLKMKVYIDKHVLDICELEKEVARLTAENAELQEDIEQSNKMQLFYQTEYRKMKCELAEEIDTNRMVGQKLTEAEANNQRLRAVLASLYNHTKNNKHIAGLNEKAREALEGK